MALGFFHEVRVSARFCYRMEMVWLERERLFCEEKVRLRVTHTHTHIHTLMMLVRIHASAPFSLCCCVPCALGVIGPFLMHAMYAMAGFLRRYFFLPRFPVGEMPWSRDACGLRHEEVKAGRGSGEAEVWQTRFFYLALEVRPLRWLGICRDHNFSSIIHSFCLNNTPLYTIPSLGSITPSTSSRTSTPSPFPRLPPCS
jgi:hypothetical protein